MTQPERVRLLDAEVEAPAEEISAGLIVGEPLSSERLPPPIKLPSLRGHGHGIAASIASASAVNSAACGAVIFFPL